MRDSWEIMKLGDLTTTLNGLWVGKKPPFVNIAVIRNTNFTKDCQLDTTDIAYIDAEVKHFSTRKLQCGDIIIEKSGGSDKQPVGRPVLFNIPGGDYSFSNFTSTLRINDRSKLHPSFLHKVLWAIYRSGRTASMQSKTTGLRNLDFKSYLKLPIPVPPIQEQERIVAELDILSEVIAKKKQQLEELDKLAQSIFYDMFGDPITNEKGWAVEKVINAVSLQRGFDLPVQSRSSTGTIPIFGSNGIIGRHNVSKVEKGIITGRSGTIGLVYSCEEPFWPLNTTLFSTNTHGNNLTFLRFLLSAFNLKRYAEGAGVPTLNRNLFHNEPIISVPVPLQDLFAHKIEVIEKQKELVKRSIVETETLFSSRMYYWFN